MKNCLKHSNYEVLIICDRKFLELIMILFVTFCMVLRHNYNMILTLATISMVYLWVKRTLARGTS